MNPRLISIVAIGVVVAQCKSHTPDVPPEPAPVPAAPPPAEAPAPRVVAAARRGEYAIFNLALQDYLSRKTADVILVRDSAIGYGSAGQMALLLVGDSLKGNRPLIVLGDSIERARDWRAIYDGRPGASDILRFYRPVFSSDGRNATAWLQARCAQVRCGELTEYRLAQQPPGRWFIVQRKHVRAN